MSQSNNVRYVNLTSLIMRENRLARNIKTIDAASNINVNFQYYSLLEVNPRKGTSLYNYSIMAKGLRINLSDVLKVAHYINDLNDNKVVYSENFLDIETEDLIKYICKEIKNERKNQRYTQSKFAEKFGFDRRYFGYIENGEKIYLSLLRFIDISDILDVPLYVLVERAEQALLNEANKNEN